MCVCVCACAHVSLKYVLFSLFGFCRTSITRFDFAQQLQENGKNSVWTLSFVNLLLRGFVRDASHVLPCLPADGRGAATCSRSVASTQHVSSARMDDRIRYTRVHGSLDKFQTFTGTDLGIPAFFPTLHKGSPRKQIDRFAWGLRGWSSASEYGF